MAANKDNNNKTEGKAKGKNFLITVIFTCDSGKTNKTLPTCQPYMYVNKYALVCCMYVYICIPLCGCMPRIINAIFEEPHLIVVQRLV